MLPDFPEPKAKMRRRLTAMMKMAVDEQAPLAAGIKARLQVEGDAFSFETAEGKVETKKFKEISVKFEIPKGLSPQKTEEELAVKLKEVASSMARQTEGLLFSTLDGATKASGNAFDARGRPFHLSMFWDAVEKMDVDFDERGNAELPTIFLHPEMMKSIEPRLAEWAADLELQKRRTLILERKKEEWRDREADRKLVE